MFWNKKEDKSGLPDLPPLPANMSVRMDSNSKPEVMKVPPIAEEVEDEEKEDMENLEKHNLPSFPDSPIEKGFSQSAIKDAVKTEMVHELPEPPIPAQDKKFKIVEEEEWTPRKPAILEEDEMPITSKKRGDVFVKIDKFYSAKKSINAAKIKLDEIDELLKRIRDTKLREDQELTSWEKEVGALKSKLQDVETNIFEKTE